MSYRVIKTSRRKVSAIQNAYIRGVPVDAIASEHGMSRGTVYRWLRKSGVRCRSTDPRSHHSRRIRARREAILEMRRRGMPTKAIAKAVGVSERHVRRLRDGVTSGAAS